MPARVFLSYRRDDSKHAAGRIAERLDERFTLFMDVDRIRPGTDFTVVVRDAVDKTDVLLAIIGSQWMALRAGESGPRIAQAGDWVAEEVGTALQRGTPVIPVLVDGARMPTREDLPARLANLASLQALTVSHESFAADCARLVDTIEGIVSTATPEVFDVWQDPDYPLARAAFLRGMWPAAIEGYERVLRRHPRQPRLEEDLEQARRRQQLAELQATADEATAAGRWSDTVRALQGMEALGASPGIGERLAEARLHLRISGLSDDIHGLAARGAWEAVLAANDELAGLDAAEADPDGLATKARAEVFEREMADAYATGVRQLEAEDWAAASVIFSELLVKKPGYRDAEELRMLARRKGQPIETDAPSRNPAAPSRTPTPNLTSSSSLGADRQLRPTSRTEEGWPTVNSNARTSARSNRHTRRNLVKAATALTVVGAIIPLIGYLMSMGYSVGSSAPTPIPSGTLTAPSGTFEATSPWRFQIIGNDCTLLELSHGSDKAVAGYLKVQGEAALLQIRQSGKFSYTFDKPGGTCTANALTGTGLGLGKPPFKLVGESDSNAFELTGALEVDGQPRHFNDICSVEIMSADFGLKVDGADAPNGEKLTWRPNLATGQAYYARSTGLGCDVDLREI